MLDPDGAVANFYETKVIRAFEDESDRPPEALAYAGWIRDWVDAGNRLDLVFNLHNVESGEGPHLFIFMNDPTRQEESKKLHRAVAAALPGYETRGTDRVGRFSTRLGGWLRNTFGTHMMFYESNSQAPSRHLSLYELKAMGVGILIGAVQHLADADSLGLRKDLQISRDTRYAKWERYGYLRGAFNQAMNVFDQEATLGMMSGYEAYLRERQQKRQWLTDLYDRIDQGILPRIPQWSQ